MHLCDTDGYMFLKKTLLVRSFSQNMDWNYTRSCQCIHVYYLSIHVCKLRYLESHSHGQNLHISKFWDLLKSDLMPKKTKLFRISPDPPPHPAPPPPPPPPNPKRLNNGTIWHHHFQQQYRVSRVLPSNQGLIRRNPSGPVFSLSMSLKQFHQALLRNSPDSRKCLETYSSTAPGRSSKPNVFLISG